jgi:hypothetical protein
MLYRLLVVVKCEVRHIIHTNLNQVVGARLKGYTAYSSCVAYNITLIASENLWSIRYLSINTVLAKYNEIAT